MFSSLTRPKHSDFLRFGFFSGLCINVSPGLPFFLRFVERLGLSSEKKPEKKRNLENIKKVLNKKKNIYIYIKKVPLSHFFFLYIYISNA